MKKVFAPCLVIVLLQTPLFKSGPFIHSHSVPATRSPEHHLVSQNLPDSVFRQCNKRILLRTILHLRASTLWNWQKRYSLTTATATATKQKTQEERKKICESKLCKNRLYTSTENPLKIYIEIV